MSAVERASGANSAEQVNERRERCERTSDWRNKWPSTLRVDFIAILPNVECAQAKKRCQHGMNDINWLNRFKAFHFLQVENESSMTHESRLKIINNVTAEPLKTALAKVNVTLG